MVLDSSIFRRYSRRRFIQLSLLSTGSATMLANCRRSNEARSPTVAELSTGFDWQRFQGQTITLLLDEHPWTTGVQPLLADFEALTGIRLNVRVVPEPAYFQKLETVVRSEPVGADVFFLPMDSTAYRLWQDNRLLPLTPFINDSQLTKADYNLFDFPEGFRLAATYPPEAEVQQLYGIPATFETYILFYNKRLVNEHLGGEVPKTMADLVDAAFKLNQAGQGKFFGAVMRGIKSDAIIDTVTGIVLDSWGSESTPLPYNLWFDEDWSRPRFTHPRIVEGLATYARLMQAGPPNIKNMDWPQATELFHTGKAAFYIDASLFGPSYETETSAIAGDVGYAVLPKFHRDSLTGHWLWGLGIAQNSKHPEAAWMFVQWATSQSLEPQISVLTGGAPRFSSWLNPSVYTKAMNTDYALTVQTAMQTSRPTIVLHSQWNEAAIAIAGTIQTIYDGANEVTAAHQLQAQVSKIMAQEAS